MLRDSYNVDAHQYMSHRKPNKEELLDLELVLVMHDLEGNSNLNSITYGSANKDNYLTVKKTIFNSASKVQEAQNADYDYRIEFEDKYEYLMILKKSTETENVLYSLVLLPKEIYDVEDRYLNKN